MKNGFLTFPRQNPVHRSIEERIHDNLEIENPWGLKTATEQASRCMGCGTPFCESGCPLKSDISEWIEYFEKGALKESYEVIESTNNFPEFTGRLCPAPCEHSCVLEINQLPVAIASLEKYITDLAFSQDLVRLHFPEYRTGKQIAVVGSGPTGLACAQDLNRKGHWVTVFERNDRLGGMLRHIPEFRLPNYILERRLSMIANEGVKFYNNITVGLDIKANDLLNNYDAIVLAGGCTVPRDIHIPGRHLKGIYFVMELLVDYEKYSSDGIISNLLKSIQNRHVIITSSSIYGWVGILNRLGAASVTALELMPMPPENRSKVTPWPHKPLKLNITPFHEEGVDLHYSIRIKDFIGDENGDLKAISVVDLTWYSENGRMGLKDVTGSERIVPCDIVIINAGYLHPQHHGLLDDLGMSYDERGNVKTFYYQTTVNQKVFSAGDMRRGQSSIPYAISEGKAAARSVNVYLTGADF